MGLIKLRCWPLTGAALADDNPATSRTPPTMLCSLTVLRVHAPHRYRLPSTRMEELGFSLTRHLL